MQALKYALLGFIILVTGLWGSLALYFGDSDSRTSQQILSWLFGLCSLSALMGLWLRGWRGPLLIGYFAIFFAVLGWWFNISPSNGRQWQADAEKLAFATLDGDRVTVHNIRNFAYKTEFDYRPAYYDKTFELNKLEGIDLFSVYWMGPAIAHTIISFHFGDADYLAVSIEARKELNEGYSTIKGFFRQYELIYFVADERDVIRLRGNYRKNPEEQVYLFRLQGSKDQAKRLFLEYVRQINRLNREPAFYNTLLDNCTTAIWFRTLVNPEHLAFSWKVLLSGYLPEYLYETGRLDTRMPFSVLRERALINGLARAADQSADFSVRIRARLEPLQQ